jgi:GNAT superfamily N-acetyltransferase
MRGPAATSGRLWQYGFAGRPAEAHDHDKETGGHRVMHVRAMERDDIPKVSDLLCACYGWLAEREPLTPREVRFLVEQRGSIDTVKRESETESYFVACDDAEIAGMVSVRGNEITKLYVHPKCHRKGLGRMLYEKAEEVILGAGYTRIKLVAIGETPVPFYGAMGMKISGRKPWKAAGESGREAILMEKSLTAEPDQKEQVHGDGTRHPDPPGGTS